MFTLQLFLSLGRATVRRLSEKKGKERIMMFVSMVNSRFYVHVILL